MAATRSKRSAFSQATPVVGATPTAPIIGTFSLWFDANGNGVQDPGEVTAPINFFEDAYNSGNPNYDPAMAMQAALRNLGGSLADVTVRPPTPTIT